MKISFPIVEIIPLCPMEQWQEVHENLGFGPKAIWFKEYEWEWE